MARRQTYRHLPLPPKDLRAVFPPNLTRADVSAYNCTVIYGRTKPVALRRIGLLGCGAIGSVIADAVSKGQVKGASLERIYDVDSSRSEALATRLPSVEIAANPHLLSSRPVDLVVEAASQEAVRNAGLSILQNRSDLVVMSVGALLDDAVRDVLDEACRDFGRSVHVPSGAIAGLDALKAARDQIDSVVITTTKPPTALRGAPFFKGKDPDVVEPTVIFEGTASEAASLFPANVNVAAATALASVGGQRTRVRVVADPAATRNTHRIEAEGGFGKLLIEIQNVPSDNPRTSKLAALSCVELLRQICSPSLRVGT